MTDTYFWLGDDGELDLVSEKTFDALQNSKRLETKRWREIDDSPQLSYFFYGVMEPIEDDEDNLEANDKWDDLLNYGERDEYEPA